MDDTDLRDVIQHVAEVSSAFLSGDPGPFAALWSAADDVTIFGGFGAGERGREAVLARLTWASARFRDGEVSYEQIASGSSGELGYAVGIERGRAVVEGRQEPGDLVLRVTHLFRREQGRWRLIHRHADPVTDVIATDGILGAR